VDVPDLAVLDQGSRDEQPVVGRFLDERDDRREAAGRAGELRQPRVVEAHRDFRGEILELVAGQPEFGEDHQVGPGVACLCEQVVVGREVDLERPEPRCDLGERDPACLHVREHTRWPSC
jgi:hypothetical protein